MKYFDQLILILSMLWRQNKNYNRWQDNPYIPVHHFEKEKFVF